MAGGVAQGPMRPAEPMWFPPLAAMSRIPLHPCHGWVLSGLTHFLSVANGFFSWDPWPPPPPPKWEQAQPVCGGGRGGPREFQKPL